MGEIVLKSNFDKCRWVKLDALRGAAILLMTVYHFCFDLNYFGIISQDFYQNIFWLSFRFVIVSLFLFCAGFSVSLALHLGQSSSSFWKNWRCIAFCALLVSAGSYFMFPASWISFGVLHGICVMLIIVRAFIIYFNDKKLASFLPLFFTASFLIILISYFIQDFMIYIKNSSELGLNITNILDSKLFNWLGIISQKPITEDYVPILPWIGFVFLGAFSFYIFSDYFKQSLIKNNFIIYSLSFLGKNSLFYYMVHQPIIIGVITGVIKLRQLF